MQACEEISCLQYLYFMAKYTCFYLMPQLNKKIIIEKQIII